MTVVAETLYEGKQQEELCSKIKQIPMKSEILAQDVLAQLNEVTQETQCVGWL